MKENKKVALFIDCENVSHNFIDDIISDLASYGEVHIRRAYGNWQSETIKGWNQKLFDFSLEPIYQPPYVSGKNATDIKMTVDIMKILCQNQTIDYVALATSDSDFTPLVTEIKAQGIQVLGYGEEKTNNVLKDACEFRELGKKSISKSELKKDTKLINRIKHAINNTKGDNGWANVSEFGAYFKNNYSKTAKNYGNYKTWGELLRDLPIIVEVEAIMSTNNNRDTLIVRIK